MTTEDEVKKILNRLGEKSETDLDIETRLCNLEKTVMRLVAMVINIIKGLGLDKEDNVSELEKMYT